ncbi:hypothetical protein MNB_SUP05-SYMBIONT-4-1103 [hydrothermal vent metagenome]|uniref:Uncharacterized protein n=1 Tax=hydrothermal vent metagenome TaxID=652676 RepID=A0A1W1DYD9_9ZZZZ
MLGKIVADAELVIVFEVFDELGNGALIVVESVGAVKGRGVGKALSAKIKVSTNRMSTGLAAVDMVGEVLGAGVTDAKLCLF